MASNLLKDLKWRFFGTDFKKGLMKNFSWMAGGKFGAQAIHFVFMFLAMRILGRDGFGVYALIVYTMPLATIFVNARSSDAIVKLGAKYLAADKRKARAVIDVALLQSAVLGIIGMAAVLLLAPVISVHLIVKGREIDIGTGGTINAENVTLLIRIFSVTVLINLVSSTVRGVFQLLGNFRYLGFAQFLVHLLRGICAIIPLLLGWGLSGVIIGIVISKIIYATVNFVYLLVFAGGEFKNVKPSSRLAAFKEVLPYSFHFFVSEFFKGLITICDRWIIRQFVPIGHVGLYSYAKSFANIPTAVIPIVTPVILPELTRTFERKDFTFFRKILRKSTFYLGALAIAAAVVMMMIVPFVFAMKDKAGQDQLGALPVFFILIWLAVINCALYWIRPVVVSIGHPEISSKASIAGGIFIVGVLALSTYGFGYIGGAAGYLAGWIFVHCVSLYLINKHFPLFPGGGRRAPEA